MKTLINKPAVTIILLIAIAGLIHFSNAIASRMEQLQAAAITSSQPGSEPFSARYSDVINILYFASGR